MEMNEKLSGIKHKICSVFFLKKAGKLNGKLTDGKTIKRQKRILINVSCSLYDGKYIMLNITLPFATDFAFL